MHQVIIKCGDHILSQWVANMSRLLPSQSFLVLPYNSEHIAPELVDYVIGWCPDARWVNSFPNIKALISIGSGVDHIGHLDELDDRVPVIRTVSEDLAQRMREYVAMCILAWHRNLLPILNSNEAHSWDRFVTDTAQSVEIGIMGYGGMGSAVARTMDSLGYRIRVWASRMRADVPYPYYHGREELTPFASDCNAIICLLPLTAETENILSSDLFNAMAPGGCLVNAARGAHLIDDDLVAALSTGQLENAFLDGLREEPLPPESPIWQEKRIIVTCHSAAYISPDAGPRIIARNLLGFDRGEPVGPMYDPSLGY